MTRDVSVSAGDEFGARVRSARTRRGLSRDAVAGLCGRSEEWLRQIERGRRGTSLKMVLRLAEVLRVANLADLLGQDTPTAVFAHPEHPALGAIRRALVSSAIAPGEAPDVEQLRVRVTQAWRLRALSPRDRTDLAAVLPGLLVDGQRTISAAAGPGARRAACSVLAEVYHLAQMYLCYQNAPELLWVAVDRAGAVSREADDAAQVGRAAWFSAYLYRDFGHLEQAHQVIDDAVLALETAEPTARVARQRSVVHLASAWNFAREGRAAEAWREWDTAVEFDRDAGPVPGEMVLFGADVGDVALALDVELGRPAAASRRAEATDLDTVVSIPRRARLTIEAARGQVLKREYTGGVHLLRRAYETSPEATLFSAYARTMVHELSSKAGPMLRREVAELADKLSLAAA